MMAARKAFITGLLLAGLIPFAGSAWAYSTGRFTTGETGGDFPGERDCSRCHTGTSTSIPAGGTVSLTIGGSAPSEVSYTPGRNGFAHHQLHRHGRVSLRFPTGSALGRWLRPGRNAGGRYNGCRIDRQGGRRNLQHECGQLGDAHPADQWNFGQLGHQLDRSGRERRHCHDRLRGERRGRRTALARETRSTPIRPPSSPLRR